MKIEPYTIIQKGKTATICINDPSAVESEDFICNLAGLIACGKLTEIDCGTKGERSHLIAKKLCSPRIQAKIFEQDRYEFSYDEPYTKYLWESWFSIRGHTFVTFKKDKEVLKSDNATDPNKYYTNEPTNISEEIPSLVSLQQFRRKNNIAVIKFKDYKPTNIELYEIVRITSDRKIAEILCKDFSSTQDIYGPLFARIGFMEMLIDINGCDMTHHNEMLTTSIDYLIKKNFTVTVDWDEILPGELEQKLSLPPFSELNCKIKIDQEEQKNGNWHTIAKFN